MSARCKFMASISKEPLRAGISAPSRVIVVSGVRSCGVLRRGRGNISMCDAWVVVRVYSRDG